MKQVNKTMGNHFEEELCELLAEQGFWAHNLAQNQVGQPADVLAVRDNIAILIDCKVCSNNRFPLSRIEPNQEAAMTMWEAQGNEHLLKNSKIHPRLAFEHCGLFVDSDLAYTLSAEYAEEQEKKAQELLEKQNTEKEDETDDPNTDKGNGAAGGNTAQARQQSGSAD